MAGFFYFLPSIEPVADPRQLIIDVGLSDTLSDVPPEEIVCSSVRKGPDDLAGVLLYPKPRDLSIPSSVQYRPEKQKFVPVQANAGDQEEESPASFYIGWLLDALPTPEDLARRKQTPGRIIWDEAGREWLIPVARSEGSFCGRLPCDIYFEGGAAMQRCKSEYRWLFELGLDAWNYLTGLATDGESEFSPLQKVGMVMKVLAANYRIGPPEVTALADMQLPLVDTTRIETILCALCDLEIQYEWNQQKKTDA